MQASQTPIEILHEQIRIRAQLCAQLLHVEQLMVLRKEEHILEVRHYMDHHLHLSILGVEFLHKLRQIAEYIVQIVELIHHSGLQPTWLGDIVLIVWLDGSGGESFRHDGHKSW